MPLTLIELVDPIVIFLSVVSGIIIGFSLRLVGGGGSVLAVPLLLYLVGVSHTHIAIGTSALAVGAIAGINLLNQRKLGDICLKKGLLFAIPGIVGTIVGAQLGLLTPPENLLIIFGGFMVIIGILILRMNPPKVRITGDKTNLILLKKNVPISGFFVGMMAGYFGIGGGFLIVPSMMFSGSLNIIQAIGTSMISVSTFGATTATRYLIAGQVDLVIAALLVIGGIIGGLVGTKVTLAIPKENLLKIFATLLFVVASYMIVQTIIT